MIGMFVYTLLQPRIRLKLVLFIEIEKLSSKSCSKPKTVMDLTGKDYPFVAVIFAVMMFVIVYIVEYFRPWKADLSGISLAVSPSRSLRSYAWSPVVSFERLF